MELASILQTAILLAAVIDIQGRCLSDFHGVFTVQRPSPPELFVFLMRDVNLRPDGNDTGFVVLWPAHAIWKISARKKLSWLAT